MMIGKWSHHLSDTGGFIVGSVGGGLYNSEIARVLLLVAQTGFYFNSSIKRTNMCNVGKTHANT